MSTQIEAVVFDLDGTLADTFPLIIASWNAAVSGPLGRAFAPEEVIARFGQPEAEMLRRALGDEASVEAVDVFHTYYEEHHSLVRLFDGVSEMLSSLQAAGLPLAMMTGKGRRSTDITLRRLHWNSLFAAVVSGDDVVNQKPAPDGLVKVAKMLDLNPARCLFVGDTPADITAGRDAGMQTAAAAWHPVYLEVLQTSGADYWAETPRDVTRIALGAPATRVPAAGSPR